MERDVILDCEDCVYYDKSAIECEPCDHCYGFEYYKDIETGCRRDEMKPID